MKTVEQISEWLDEKYDDCHKDIISNVQNGTKVSAEEVIGLGNKMQLIDELQEFIESE